MNRTIPVLVLEDESGQLTRHYEDCPVCNGHHALKVYVASFATWSMEEKICQNCSYFEKQIDRDTKMEASLKRDGLH